MTTPNEGKTCDAVLRILEEREGARRRDLVVDTSHSRGVEAVCVIGSCRYAIEHTSIDSYPEKRLDDQHFQAVMVSLESELSRKGLLRQDCNCRANVPIYAFSGLKKSEIPAIHQSLRTWIIASVPKFSPEYRGHNLVLTAEPPAVPVPIGLECMLWPAYGDTLKVGRYAPPDLEELRRERMRAALKKKGPKLQAERAAGAISILVIEDFDSALANPVVIGSALRDELETTVGFDIDQVYLVNTHTSETWSVYQLKQDAIYWPSKIDIGPEWQEIRPDDLCDIIAAS